MRLSMDLRASYPVALAVFAFLLILTGCASAPQAEQERSVLVFSHSSGFRHESIEPGVASLTKALEAAGIEAEASEDLAALAPENLERFDAIVFVSSSTWPDKPETEWLVGERRAAIQDFLEEGKGIVGIHAASDSHYNWPWWGEMIGGYFQSHPAGTPTGRLTVVNANHPSTAGLPATFERTDEWYVFQKFSPDVTVLVTLDPASIGESGPARPISWFHEFGGGRVFYTAMGHTKETYEEPLFQQHVIGGLKWAMGDAD